MKNFWSKFWRGPLVPKMIVALFLGAICGAIFGEKMVVVKEVGDLFLNLLKMAVIPLIMANLISGIASLRDIRVFGKLGGRLLLYYAGTTSLSIIVGTVAAFLLDPGIGFNLAAGAADVTTEVPTIMGTIVGLFPSNIFAALSAGRMDQVVFFSVLVGIALLMVPGEPGNQLLKGFSYLSKLFTSLINLIMYFAPIGIFCLFGNMVGQYGSAIATLIGKFAIGMYAGTIIMITFYCILLYVFTKATPLEYFKASLPGMITAVATNSSNVAIPANIQCAQNFGVSSKVSKFTIPLGAVLNKDGMGLFLSLTFVFAAQASGVAITVPVLVQMLFIGMILTTGAGGVAGGQIVVLTILLEAFNLPVEAVAIVMAITPFTDPGQTVANVISDIAGAKIVDHRTRMAAQKKGEKYFGDEEESEEEEAAKDRIIESFR